MSDLGAEGHVINQAGEPCVNAAVIGDAGAYLHTDRQAGKFCLFCPDCSLQVRLHHPLRFPLVAL